MSVTIMHIPSLPELALWVLLLTLVIKGLVWLRDYADRHG